MCSTCFSGEGRRVCSRIVFGARFVTHVIQTTLNVFLSAAGNQDIGICILSAGWYI